MARWVFVRHGQSVANVEGWYSGHIDAPLTAEGEAQAEAVRQTLSTYRLDRVFASDLGRARRTAEIVMEGRDVPLTLTPRLRERHCGDYQGVPVVELERLGVAGLFSDFDGRPPGGESLRDVARRTLLLLAEVEVEPSVTLVVAHAGVIRSALGVLDGVPEAQIGLWRPSNCEVQERTVPPGRWAELARTLAQTR